MLSLLDQYKFFNCINSLYDKTTCKTWVNDTKKLNLKNIKDIDLGILEILKEYKYISEKKGYDQSPMDNVTNNPEKVFLFKKVI